MVNAVAAGSCLRTRIERERSRLQIGDSARPDGWPVCLRSPNPEQQLVPTGTLRRSRRPPATYRGAHSSDLPDWLEFATSLPERARRVSLPTEAGFLHAIWRELADRDERSADASRALWWQWTT